MSDDLTPAGDGSQWVGASPPGRTPPPEWGQRLGSGSWPNPSAPQAGIGREWAGQGWTATPWDSAPEPRRHRAVRAGFATVMASVIAVTVGFAVLAGGRGGSTTLAGPFQAIGRLGGGGATSGPAAGGGTGVLPAGSSASDIAAHIDPAIVDINVTVAGGEAAGTGIVLTSAGEVLTNNHVIAGATSISVQIAGQGTVHTATVRGVDVADDVAVIQIDNVSGLVSATLGDSAAAAVGDAVIAIGNAGGRGGTPAASQGTITALDQSITATDAGGGNAEALTGLIQVNAPIQPGDSGGPLVNSSGQVIGMDAAASGGRRFRRQGTTTTAGFAIPINSAKNIVQQIESGGGGGGGANTTSGQTAFLGVDLQDSASPSGSGAVIAGVQTGGPADSAGIAAGDTITGLGGNRVNSSAALAADIRAHHPGDTVTVTWEDNAGQTHTARVRLTTGPPA